MARKPLLANDPLSGGDAGSLMDGILERNRERSGRAKPSVSEAKPALEPEAFPVEDSSENVELHASTQARKRTNLQPRLRGSVEIKTAPEPAKAQTKEKSSGKNEESVLQEEVPPRSMTIRERAVELAESVRIPPTTLNTRIPEAIGDRLDELALRFKKLGVSKQSLAIALLERGLEELDREEGWRSKT